MAPIPVGLWRTIIVCALFASSFGSFYDCRRQGQDCIGPEGQCDWMTGKCNCQDGRLGFNCAIEAGALIVPAVARGRACLNGGILYKNPGDPRPSCLCTVEHAGDNCDFRRAHIESDAVDPHRQAVPAADDEALRLYVADENDEEVDTAQTKGDIRYLTVAFDGTGESKDFIVKECTARGHSVDTPSDPPSLTILEDGCFSRPAVAHFRSLTKITANPERQLIKMAFSVFKFKSFDSILFDCVVHVCSDIDDPECEQKTCSGTDVSGRHKSGRMQPGDYPLTCTMEVQLPSTEEIGSVSSLTESTFYIAGADGQPIDSSPQVMGQTRFLTFAFNTRGVYKDFIVNECTAYSNPNDKTQQPNVAIVENACFTRSAAAYFRRMTKNTDDPENPIIRIEFTVFKFRNIASVSFTCVVHFCLTDDDPDCQQKSCPSGVGWGLRRRNEIGRQGVNISVTQTIGVTE